MSPSLTPFFHHTPLHHSLIQIFLLFSPTLSYISLISLPTPIFHNTLFLHSLNPLAPPFPNSTFTSLSVPLISLRPLSYTTFSPQSLTTLSLIHSLTPLFHPTFLSLSLTQLSYPFPTPHSLTSLVLSVLSHPHSITPLLPYFSHPTLSSDSLTLHSLIHLLHPSISHHFITPLYHTPISYLCITLHSLNLFSPYLP